ncbi:MAG: hypothetical protein GY703_09310 [Gammaproteobacteria bacterium]|nr:hypothetical protein [Gammaproteobacteria bacterium]
MDKILKDEYRNGRHLIQTAERIFWVYTGTHWVKVADRVLEGELQRLARFNWSVVKAMAGEKANPKLAEVVTSALTVLGRRVVRDGDPLRMTSPQPAVINCLNGEVWLEADGAKLRAHDPESFLTSCSRIVYDPIAKAPTYARLIETMFCEPGGEPLPDQTDIARHITEMMGYAIQPVRNLKVFYLFVGDGDNGKSQLIKLYSYIVGDDAALWTRLDGIENDTNKSIGLLGKKAVIDDDASRDFLLPDGFIKRVAEEKIISSRYLFKDMVNFVAAVVPIIMGNHWPRSRDLTRGMRTRTAVVKFPRSFLKLGELDEDHKVVDADHPDVQRPDLWEQVYKEELPGVVNDWIEGYYRLKERGAFDVPASCNKAFNMWLSMANPVSRFVEECLIPGDLQKDMMHATKDLYRAYQHWAEGEGIPARFVAEKNTFRSHLADMGCKVKRREDGWHLFGYKPSDNLALFHSVNLVDEDGERIVSDREAKAEEWREENLVPTERKFAAVK